MDMHRKYGKSWWDVHIWCSICSLSQWEVEIFRSDFNRHCGFFHGAKPQCKASQALNTGADGIGARVLAGWRRYKYYMGWAWRESLIKRIRNRISCLVSPRHVDPPPAPTNQHHQTRLATPPPLQSFGCPFPGSRWQCCAVSSHLVSTLLPPRPPSSSSSFYLAFLVI